MLESLLFVQMRKVTKQQTGIFIFRNAEEGDIFGA